MWFCGVTVSTPDSESGDPSSNLGRTLPFRLPIAFYLDVFYCVHGLYQPYVYLSFDSGGVRTHALADHDLNVAP